MKIQTMVDQRSQHRRRESDQVIAKSCTPSFRPYANSLCYQEPMTAPKATPLSWIRGKSPICLHNRYTLTTFHLVILSTIIRLRTNKIWHVKSILLPSRCCETISLESLNSLGSWQNYPRYRLRLCRSGSRSITKSFWNCSLAMFPKNQRLGRIAPSEHCALAWWARIAFRPDGDHVQEFWQTIEQSFNMWDDHSLSPSRVCQVISYVLASRMRNLRMENLSA